MTIAVADPTMRLAEIRAGLQRKGIHDAATAAAVLAPLRRPGQWCLCGNVGCIGWSDYVEDCMKVYGHEPTDAERKADAEIYRAVHAFPEGGVR